LKAEGRRTLGTVKVLAIVLMIALAALAIYPQRAYGLTGGRATVTGLVTKPGNKVLFKILLNYTVSPPYASITYDLMARNLPNGWIAKFYKTYEGHRQEITSLTIEYTQILAQGLVDVDLEVEVPKAEKPGHYAFLFYAKGRESLYEAVMFELTVDVEALKREIKLSTEYPDVTVERQGTAGFAIVLDNVGETDELANLTAEYPDGWRVTFRGQSGDIFGVFVPKGQSAIIQAQVEPPEGVAAGVYDFAIMAQSSDLVANSTLKLKVAVVKAGTAEKMLSTLYPELNIEGAKTIFFPITIRNLGASSLIYRLTPLSVPSGWTVSFRTTPDDRTSSVSSIFLVGGEFATLYLEAAPPATVALGTYAFTVRATSEEGASQDLTVAAKITGSYEITMDLDTLYAQIRAGETASVIATVTNIGASELTNVSLDVTPPSADWQVTKTPTFYDTLRPGGYATITLMLKAPGNAEIGDYLIGVRATSDRVRSTQILLRVNVQSASISLWVVGIAAIVIAVVAIALVYLRFGRKR